MSSDEGIGLRCTDEVGFTSYLFSVYIGEVVIINYKKALLK